MSTPKRYYKNLNEMTIEESRVDLESFFQTDEVVHCNTDGSEVVEFFDNKVIFITGGTGLLGKLLIEKLLRSCRNIKKIYILVREKKNMNFTSRAEQLLQGVVFKELKKVQPDFYNKIISLNGDISLPNLGLREEDQERLKSEVNVIFHVAASVNLDEKLSSAAKTNVESTIGVISLARSCKNLMSIVHVSTAYSNCMLTKIEEKIYTPSITVEVLEKLQSLEEISDVEERRILGQWPNSYILTKNMAENIVYTRARDLPVCIFRPAIITNTFREPIKGYIDNFHGSCGIIANTNNGIMRVLHADRDTVLDHVPADFVVNGLIVAAYKNNFLRRGNVMIYNYASSVENPILLGDAYGMTTFFGKQTPPMRSLWYPSLTIKLNHYVYWFLIIFLHFLPALIFDSYNRLLGRKPWMFSLYKKICRFNQSLVFFGTRQWEFETNNVQGLWNELSDVDKKIFPFSMSKDLFNWNDYIKQMSVGIRLYVLKDTLDTIPKAILRLEKQCYYQKIIKYTLASVTCSMVALLIAYFM